MHCTVYVVKANALISFVVTVKLICAYALTYAKSRFSHAAQLSINLLRRLVVLMHKHKVENRVTRVLLSEIYQEKSLIYFNQFLNEYKLIYS